MESIKIKRVRELCFITPWKYEIYIDGNFVGTLKRGDTKEFPTTEGKHTVEAKTMLFHSSPKISVDVQTLETKYMIVGMSQLAYFNIFILLAFFVFHSIALAFKIQYLIDFYLLLLLILVIYSAFRRKNYLYLTEI